MDVVSPELPQFIRLLLALALVLALMGGLAYLLKRLGLSTNTPIKKGDNRRLGIVEALPLDARRRLVIVSCDDKEHLVILGATSETVVQNDIASVDGSKDSSQGS